MESRFASQSTPASTTFRDTFRPDGWSSEDLPLFTRGRKAIETSLMNHPAVGLGIALACGALLGWLIKRR